MCVLVFPPFSPKCRFLAHKVVEDYFPNFCSFSIGQDDCRRLVVCSFELSQRNAWPHSCVHRKLACLSAEEKPVTCSCDTRKPAMSSSVPKEHSSEKYGRRSPFSDTGRKSNISSKGVQESEEFPSQTKSNRMKQKRPDMPLYVPRARRLQEDSESQCTSRYTSPGRQKGKRSSAQPLEAQNKRLPKSTRTKTVKAGPPHDANSSCEALISVGEKTCEKNSSSVVLVKLSHQGKSDLDIEKPIHEEVDLKPTVSMSSTALFGKDYLSSDDSNNNMSDWSVDGISNNSIVMPNTRSTADIELKNPDYPNLETSADGNVVFSDSVPVIFNTAVGSLNSAEVSLQSVSEFSIETSVPLVSNDVNEECLSSVQGKTSHPICSNQTTISTCPEEELSLESLSRENTSPDTGSISVQNNLNESSKESASHCSPLSSASVVKVFDCGSENVMVTSSTVIHPSQVEIIISEKNTVIQNLSDCADCVQIVTSEKISYFTSSKEECDSKDEDGKSNLSTHNDMDGTSVEEAPVNMEPPNESCISSLSVYPEIIAPSKIHSGDLNPPKIVEVCDEKVSVSSTVLPDNGDSASEVESWDSMFDDDGECVNPELVKELITAVGNVQIKTTKQDYAEYKPIESTVDEEYGNIIEIYGFPVEFQTQDLISAFSCFRTEDFTIKWVDDCHALGIFSGAFAASEALTLQHPYVKVRPLSQGIRESKLKAKRYAEHLLPYKPRPATSATLARRLVTGALGLKSNVSREQRETERLAIKQARDRKRQVAKQRQDIWNGIVS